jgi:PTH1 family peptidyl-tRNA hydrolase
MNESGKAVKSIINFHKIKKSDLITSRMLDISGVPPVIIVHDDIDLPLGKIKIIKNRGSAGHKGIESIIKELGSKNFIRFRIGILPQNGKPKNPEKFVLQKFNKSEEIIIKEIINKTVEAISVLLKEGIEEAMNKYNS